MQVFSAPRTTDEMEILSDRVNIRVVRRLQVEPFGQIVDILRARFMHPIGRGMRVASFRLSSQQPSPELGRCTPIGVIGPICSPMAAPPEVPMATSAFPFMLSNVRSGSCLLRYAVARALVRTARGSTWCGDQVRLPQSDLEQCCARYERHYRRARALSDLDVQGMSNDEVSSPARRFTGSFSCAGLCLQRQ